jgi:hypothetical protein
MFGCDLLEFVEAMRRSGLGKSVGVVSPISVGVNSFRRLNSHK